MRPSAAALLCLGLFGGLAVERVTWASEDDASHADALFRHAVELMKADHCSDAVPEFLKSQKLDASSATLLNLGTCYARLGRKATAFKTYREAARSAQAEKNDEVRERALQAMALLGPTLTKLQIVTPPGTSALAVRINGELVENYDGLPIPLDPGESLIEAAAPGREPWRRSITADDLGATLVLQIPELPPAPPPPPAPAPVAAPRPGMDWRVPAAIITGTGLSALVVGAVFGVSAQHTYDDSLQHCAGNACTQAGIDLRDSARSKARVSSWMIGLGAVATTGGVVLWLINPGSSPARSESARGGLRATGTWLMVEVRR